VEDPIFTAEFTEVLGEPEAVDLLWADACSFGGIENAYQFRPVPGRFHAHAMLATPPISSAGPMREILERSGFVGPSAKKELCPATGADFGRLAVAAIEKGLRRRVISNRRLERESWGCYDLTKVSAVKSALDSLAVSLANSDAKDLAEEIRGSGDEPHTMNYIGFDINYPWLTTAHFDLYDLARRLSSEEGFGSEVRSRAARVAEAVDDFMISSVGMGRYEKFEPGRNGVYVVFPDGDATVLDRRSWSFFRWYHPDDRRQFKAAFGNLDWCRDGATRGNGEVENWFELLDSWFDDVEADPGGLNDYAI